MDSTVATQEDTMTRKGPTRAFINKVLDAGVENCDRRMMLDELLMCQEAVESLTAFLRRLIPFVDAGRLEASDQPNWLRIVDLYIRWLERTDNEWIAAEKAEATLTPEAYAQYCQDEQELLDVWGMEGSPIQGLRGTPWTHAERQKVLDHAKGNSVSAREAHLLKARQHARR